MERIRVILVDWLPGSAREMVTYTFDGEDCYTIFINNNLSDSGKLEAYRHGLSHIENGDFFAMENVNKIESIRHSAR